MATEKDIKAEALDALMGKKKKEKKSWFSRFRSQDPNKELGSFYPLVYQGKTNFIIEKAQKRPLLDGEAADVVFIDIHHELFAPFRTTDALTTLVSRLLKTPVVDGSFLILPQSVDLMCFWVMSILKAYGSNSCCHFLHDLSRIVEQATDGLTISYRRSARENHLKDRLTFLELRDKDLIWKLELPDFGPIVSFEILIPRTEKGESIDV